MRAVFITEGKKDIGFGHITRCLGIAKAFEERKVKTLLIVNGDKSILNLLNKESFKIIDWINNEDKLFSILKTDDIVIIDSYLADCRFYEKVSKLARLTVYIDDNNRLSYPKGIVINGNIYGSSLNYQKNKFSQYLLGPKYAPLRKEFWDVSIKKINKKIKNILVTFGGDDKRNLTSKVLSLLQKNYPNINTKFIIGKGFLNKSKLHKFKNSKTEFKYDPNTKQIKELMANSDLVISASGQTTLELLRLGIPTIIIKVAENQANIAKALTEKHIVEYAGDWKDKSLFKRLGEKIKKLENYEERKNISNLQKNIIDGQGARRIIKFIINDNLSKSLVLREANIEDLTNVYKLSNEKFIRKNSLNQDQIIFKDHVNWFKEKISNKNIYFVVAYLDNKLVGQVRFKIWGNLAVISVSISNNFRGLGLGKHILMKSLIKLKHTHNFIKKINAVVKKSNKISQAFFLNNNFKIKQIKKDTILYTYNYDF
ncbi:MAG: UDP-2,4-diacetamido-2,4,6-trideoxy-beta-L-altropyranose hydrolase [Patescibacteria group bacterium]|jgi:UDP-2,4-diacetamido-2,4,6-trideoxy-beta-L-altropyranose hydrolase